MFVFAKCIFMFIVKAVSGNVERSDPSLYDNLRKFIFACWSYTSYRSRRSRVLKLIYSAGKTMIMCGESQL